MYQGERYMIGQIQIRTTKKTGILCKQVSDASRKKNKVRDVYMIVHRQPPTSFSALDCRVREVVGKMLPFLGSDHEHGLDHRGQNMKTHHPRYGWKMIGQRYE